MIIHIDPDGDLAIYDQIIRQVKFAIAKGVVDAGELLPSVRELAKELTINPNTVARAYQELQNEEILESVRGLGLRICAKAPKKCQQERQNLIRIRLASILQEGLQSGLTADELKSLVQSELQSLKSGKATA